MSDPSGMLGWSDVRKGINTGVSVATGGGADCVMGVTCDDNATNASGMCTVGVNCTKGTKSFSESTSWGRTVLVTSLVVGGGALLVAGGVVAVGLLAAYAEVSPFVAAGLLGVGVPTIGGTVAEFLGAVYGTLSGNCSDRLGTFVKNAHELNGPSSGSQGPEPIKVDGPGGVITLGGPVAPPGAP